jgi:hypothetical protein
LFRLKPSDPTMASEHAVRPWSTTAVQKALQRETEYHRYLLGDKTPIPSPNIPWEKEPFNTVKRIPDEEWTVFAGDMVQVMVGKDRGSQSDVSYVIRDANAVFVRGLHTVGYCFATDG